MCSQFCLDTASEVKRALQTLSVALVVDEDNDNLVRPHLLAQSAPTATVAVSEKRRRGVECVKELRLSKGECDAVKDVGFKHLLLSHYRNQLLHWFAPEAMLALSLSHTSDNCTDIGEFVLSYYSLL